MTREWKPGDVALLTWSINRDGWLPVVRSEARWHLLDYLHPDDEDFLSDEWLAGLSDVKIRPLVVIDPEDRDQVERLTRIFMDDHDSGDETADMQAALREFANPTPPRPEEPKGLGAVVEDAECQRWVRAGISHREADDWRCVEGEMVGYWSAWADVKAVRVLSEGWSE